MRLLTAAVLTASIASVPAHADGRTFTGACRVATVEDVTPGGVLGGPGTWHGEVNVAVVANDHGPISASCSIKINGVDQGVALTAPERLGATAAAGPLSFTAGPGDDVVVCTHVHTSAGDETVCPVL